MPRIYRVPFNFALTAAGTDADLVIIEPASNKPCRLIGWILGQTSEVGDAMEEGVRLTVRHMTATVSKTGGTGVTPVANRPGTADVVAAGFTATCFCTTVATTSGTSVIAEELGWNLRSSPWERWIPEELRNIAINGEALIVRLETTLADDVAAPSTFFVEEFP